MGHLVKTTKWSKILESHFMEKKKKQFKIAERRNTVNLQFLVVNFVLFPYKQRVISKHQTLALTYVLITNNLKLTTAFLTMTSLILKFQILIYNNDFRIDMSFLDISVTFSGKN